MKYLADTPWMEEEKKKYPSLGENLSADVVVIGGGITGILNAYFLSQVGKKVILIERNELGSYATLRTTALITQAIDTNIYQAVKIFGEENTKQIWESGRQAIEEIEKIVNAEKIGCEFKRCSNYMFASTHRQFGDLENDYGTYQKLGFEATLNPNGRYLNFPNFGYVEIPHQAKFNPAKFIFAAAEAASRNGALIFEHTEALDISGEDSITVNTKQGSITADQVIVATYRPLSQEGTRLKKGSYRSYVFEIELPKNVLKEGIYEDDSNPYYYFRVDSMKKKDRLIIGGEDHRSELGSSLREKSFHSLAEFVSRILPGVDYGIVRKWTGPILEPSDGLPLIGSIKPNYYVASAFSGNGMTYSMISAILIRDLILGKENIWADLYDPIRSLDPARLARKAKDYIGEFFGGAVKNLLTEIEK